MPLPQALGRILAEDMVSPVNIPPAPNSAVDGYAVFHADLDPEKETRLPVAGRVTAGQMDLPAARPGAAVRIFTGARLPEGPDTVMMQEDCQLEPRVDGDHVIIRPGIKKGSNARTSAGEDVARRATWCCTGVSACGPRTSARPPPSAAARSRSPVACKVGLFSTGDELREPGGDLDPGAIYDSNRYTIHALLTGLGCRSRRPGHPAGPARRGAAGAGRGRRANTTCSSPPAASPSARRTT